MERHGRALLHQQLGEVRASPGKRAAPCQPEHLCGVAKNGPWLEEGRPRWRQRSEEQPVVRQTDAADL